MASQSLYRKWRSQTFSDLVGQEEIVQTLRNALASGKLSHAYLFTGPRGTGKTSTARLLAKTLNCTNRKNGEPCNECEQCREITAGNSFNVIEIDAASNRGIDSIRELREKVMVRPSTGTYKIYILDEAHMLTTEAFNALLKTLEEPPEHAIFVMATTDVHKMLPTVLSRCQRFDFKRITTRQIVKHLQFVATEEHVELERGAAELIARAAAGGMRDALSLLDQAIAYSGEQISLTQVQTMLGIADPRAIQKFITHVAQLDSAAGLHLIHELAEAGADLRQINGQVAEYWRAMMLVRAGADIATILDSTEDEVREITQTAKLFALDELTDCARIFAQNDLMQKNQGTPQLGLELALLSVIERHRQSAVPSSPALSNVGQVEIAVPKINQPVAPPVVKPAPQTSPANASTASGMSTPPSSTNASPALPSSPVNAVSPIQVQKEKPEKLEDKDEVKRAPFDEEITEDEAQEEHTELPEWDTLSYSEDEEDDVYEASPPVFVTPETAVTEQQYSEPEPISHIEVQVPEVAASVPVEEPPHFTLADVREKWEQIKRRVKSRKEGVIASSILNDFSAVALQGTSQEAKVIAQAGHQWHYDKIQQKDYYKVIEWALKVELGQECRIQFISPTQSIPEPLPGPPSAPSLYEPHSVPTQAASYGNGSSASASSKSNGQRATRKTASQTAPQGAQHGRDSQEHSPLARMHTVRENTTRSDDNHFFSHDVYGSEIEGVGMEVASVVGIAERNEVKEVVVQMEQATPLPVVLDETRRAVLERKAQADPVVQKVTEMFRASMKEVRPK